MHRKEGLSERNVEPQSEFIDLLQVNHVKFKKEGNNDSLFLPPKSLDKVKSLADFS